MNHVLTAWNRQDDIAGGGGGGCRPPGRVAVIVNDAADVNVDGALVVLSEQLRDANTLVELLLVRNPWSKR